MARNGPANGALIRSVRERLGWTQEALASRAKLSVRVIAKAESGRPVSLTTLTQIEGALREVGVEVSAADLRRSPQAVVAELIANYRDAHHDIPVHDYIAEDVTAYVDGERSWLRVAGEHRGVDAFNRVWSVVFDCLQGDRGTLGSPAQMLVAENQVVAWGHEHLRGTLRLSGLPLFFMVRMEFFEGRVRKSWLHFDALGLAVRWRRMLEVVGRDLHGDLVDDAKVRRGKHWAP